jgi:hypothetical protein
MSSLTEEESIIIRERLVATKPVDLDIKWFVLIFLLC